jgi:pyruvate formate lyase activating enzyme
MVKKKIESTTFCSFCFGFCHITSIEAILMTKTMLDEYEKPEGDLAKAWARVRGQVASSFCDWPGKVCSVLFLGGCNFKCPTCHNADMAWRWEPLPELGRTNVLLDLKRRQRWLDGVTVTGGEPTCTPGLEDLLRDLHAHGIQVKLDSNGSRPGIIRALLEKGLVASVAIDVKGPWHMYPALTGQCMSPEAAKRNLTAIFDLARIFPERIYFRCTKVPALSEKDLGATMAQMPSNESLIFQEFVQPKA